MKYCLAVDVGATNIRVALIDKNKKIMYKVKEKSNQNKDLVELICELYKKTAKKVRINKISVGIAGSVNREKGIINDFPGLKLTNYHLKEKLEKKLKVKTFVNNDANLAALAEYSFYKQETPFLYLTISSGIGGGLIVNDKLYKGFNGVELEIGRTIIKDNTSFENLCSGNALTLRLIKEGFDLKYPSEALTKSKKKYQKVINEWLEDLAVGFSNIINVLDPKVIIVGGGLGKYLDYFKPELLKRIKQHIKNASIEKIIIEVSKFDDDNVLIGASYIKS